MSSLLLKKSQSLHFAYPLAFVLICFNISCVEPKRIVEQEKSNGLNSLAKKNHTEEIKPICDGKISTSINGIDVMEVNLWNSTDVDRIIISHLQKGEEIKILKDEKTLLQFKANALAQAKKFDIHNIVPQYEKLYERVVN